MKRIISAILCVVMLLCILPMSVFAQDKATPLILVQGYSGPSLFYDLGGENEHQVWGINMDDLKKIVIARIPELAGGLAGAAFGDYERLVKVVGEAGASCSNPCAATRTALLNMIFQSIPRARRTPAHPSSRQKARTNT